MADERTQNLLGALALSLADGIEAAARKSSGLSPSASAVLVTLGPYPGSTIGTVARILGLTHSVAVRIVDDLVREGLVQRTPGGDRRQVELRLTREGASRRRAILKARSTVLKSAIQALDAGGRAQLRDALAAMLARITESREQADHICRLCDEDACELDTCPVELRAIALEKGAGR